MSLVLTNVALPLAQFTLELNLELRGRITAILGPSGAGKTTLLELVAGLRRAGKAKIQLFERVLTDTVDDLHVPVHQRGVGYVPQDLALFPHLSVRQNLLYGRGGHSSGPVGIELERVIEVLQLPALMSRRVNEISGGERQRVALGRALLANPRILLMDEPLASLDGHLKSKIIPYLLQMRDEFKVPMVYVTHDRMEAAALADEVVVLVGGKVRQHGPVLEVFNQPANVEVARFVGVETMLPGEVLMVADGLATVKIGSCRLTAVEPASPAREVFVCLRGEDVSLQKEAGVMPSARNRLPATVMAIREAGPLVRVELDAGFPLFALVTRPAIAEMALKPGDSVTALIKAPAIHLVPRNNYC